LTLDNLLHRIEMYDASTVRGQVLFLAFDTSLAGWGEPVRAMMRNQRCDRIGWPSRS